MKAAPWAVMVAGAALLAGACGSDHLAEDCDFTLTCPPSQPAAPPPSDACEGTCVPGEVSPWWSDHADVVWMGDSENTPPCPADRAPNDIYDGQVFPAGSPCGTCTCDGPTGSCALSNWAS